MTLQQKLQALMSDRKQSTIAKRVGVHPITFAAYLKRGAIPSATVLFKISRVLGVSADWLLDPEQSWPPVRVESKKPPVNTLAA